MTFIPGPPDAELVLQASVTNTASANSAWFDLGAGFAPGGLGMPAAGVVDVTALDLTSGNETYTFKLQETDDDGTGNPNGSTIRDCGAAVSATAVGIVLAKGFITGRFVRLVLTAGGTTPSITYTGQLNP